MPVTPPLHPATVAMFELLLVLTVAAISSQSDHWRLVGETPTLVTHRRRANDETLCLDSASKAPVNHLPKPKTLRRDRRRRASLTSDL
jgi:hypothetical protein